MNYHLDKFPFGTLQSFVFLSEQDRFDQDNFDNTVNSIDPQMLVESLKKHSMALQVCEDQLKPFLRQDPFIPDYFGFKQKEVQVIDEDGNDSSYIAYTKDGATLIPDYAMPGNWKMMDENGKIIVTLLIPNAMIGFFVMASLGFTDFVSK
jgi:hypothetical protein